MNHLLFYKQVKYDMYWKGGFWNAAINIIRKAKDPLGMRQEVFSPVCFALACFVFGSSCVCMRWCYFIVNFTINL